MSRIKLAFVVFLLGVSSSAFGQMEGLWVVTKITMGEKDVTPSAKWFNFQGNDRLTSGNGWIQHTVGTWSLDGDKLFLTNENGYNETYDPFIVRQENKKMIWQKEEEGQELRIFLERANDLPESHIDKIQGLWDFDTAERQGRNVSREFDPEDNVFLWIRWDRRFLYENHPDKMNFGHWFIDPHKNEIRLMTEDSHMERWSFEVSPNRLTLTADSGETLTFNRITEFPKK